MTADVIIREVASADEADVLALYPRAFPDENLTGVVQALFDEPSALSLVAVQGEKIVGHVAFTVCGVDSGDAEISLLGPLAVDPDMQRAGIGSALVREGLAQMGGRITCVFGDPAYYGRFGFRREDGIRTPCPIPDEMAFGWQAMIPEGVKPVTGTLTVPPCWQTASLWGG